MADPYSDILKRGRAIQEENTAAGGDYFTMLERAREVAAERDSDPPPIGLDAVARHFAPLDARPLASTPASDGIPTKGQGLRVADPTAGRNLLEEADTFVRRSVKGLPIVGPSLDRLATEAESRTFGTPVAELQSRQAEADKRNPGTATAGDVTGFVAGTVPLVAAAPSAFGLRAGAGTLERVAGGFFGNAALAGADTAARGGSQDDVLNGAAVAGIVGAVFTPLLARVAGNVGGRIEGVTNPAADAIKRQAQAMYGLARQSGVNIRPQAFTTLGTDIRTALQAENFSERFIPQAIRNVQSSIDDAARSGQVTALERIELLRQEIVPLTRGATPELASQRRLAGIVLEKIDDFGENLGKANYPITNGAVTVAEQQGQLRFARELWRQQRNITVLDDALQRAQTHASGLAPGIRSEFSRLSKDRKFMAGLNTTEREAIRGVASQANLRGMLMILAKMDPSRSNLRLMAVLGGGALVGGPGGFAAGLATVGAGMAASKVTGKVMTRRANQVRRVLAGDQRISARGKTLGGQLGVAVTHEAVRERQGR